MHLNYTTKKQILSRFDEINARQLENMQVAQALAKEKAALIYSFHFSQPHPSFTQTGRFFRGLKRQLVAYYINQHLKLSKGGDTSK